MTEPYVLTIELDPEAQEDLGRITEALKVGVGDAIGRALGTEAVLLEQVANGSRVVVIDPRGHQRELMIKPEAEANGGRTASR